MSSLRDAPRSALILGLGGALPFVGLLAVAVLGSPDLHTTALLALLQYAALISTFVGALHWAWAASATPAPAGAALRYGWSVLPSLLAWGSLQLSLANGLRLQALVLVACVFADRWLLGPNGMPAWLRALRRILTLIAAGSVALASGS